jgi:hypothetical protein
LRRIPTAVAALVAVAALTAVGVVGQSRADATPAAVVPPTVAPVDSTSLVCPAPIASGTALNTTITAASAAILPVVAATSGAPGPGIAEVGPLGSSVFVPKLRLSRLDSGAGYTVTGKSTGPVVATATGTFAPGLAADQLTRGNSGRYSGLAALPCGPALTDAWFIGGGSAVGRLTQLFLSNVDDSPAQVDVLLYGTRGPISAPSALGVVVAPRSRVVISLPTLVPGQPLVALHVIAQAGRISPAVLDNQVNGLVPQGLEYLPVTSAHRRVVIPGVLSGPGSRTLMLLAPANNAQVVVSVLTVDGALTQVGLASFTLSAGRVTQVRLDKVLHGQAVGLVLTSDQPIVAGVHTVLVGSPTDTADVAGTAALDTVGMITGLSPQQSNSLVVAAPGAAGRLQITTHAVGKPVAATTRTVVIPAASSVRVSLPSVPGAAWTWVVLEPAAGSGPLYAARVSAGGNGRGTLITMTPVLPLRPLTSIPASAYQVGLDDR